MRLEVVLLCLALAPTAACKKKGGTGGGGGGWLVGDGGLMMNVRQDGTLGDGYDIGGSDALNAIACRYIDEAWVVGDGGTVLYTADAGESWDFQNLGTTANLRALATQDAGPVFIAGDGVFLTANPQLASGKAEWHQIGDGVTRFRSLAAAQRATTVLAVSDDGGVWSYAAGALARTTTIEGARGIAVSPDGTQAIVVGHGIARSTDAGATWTTVSSSGAFEAVRIDDRGDALAVGDGGAVARIDAENRVVQQTLGTANLHALHLLGYTGIGYAGGDGGQTWITRDGGWTWTAGPNVGRAVLSVDEIGAGHN
jgi:photosystem II stability/assembly factor-like uncharacterized protein